MTEEEWEPQPTPKIPQITFIVLVVLGYLTWIILTNSEILSEDKLFMFLILAGIISCFIINEIRLIKRELEKS